MLLQNKSIYWGIGRQSCSSGWDVSRYQLGSHGNNHHNKYVGQGALSKGASVPRGYRPPYCWELAMNPTYGGSSTTIGDLSIGYDASGEGLIGSTSKVVGGLNGVVSLAGFGEISSATASLIIDIAITLAGSGIISDASLAGKLEAIANLAGSGDFTAAIGAISGLTITLQGIGEVSGTSLLDAIGSMTATIYVNQSEATVQQLVDGVWEALAADHNNSGTMGQKVNAAGTSGDPWTADLDGYAAGTAGDKLKKGLTKTQFLGLK